MNNSTHIRLPLFFLLFNILLGALQATTRLHQEIAQHSKKLPVPSPSSPFGAKVLGVAALAWSKLPIQQSYAGRLNVPTNSKQTAELFFWMIPADDARGSKEITVWLNVDDACSSLVGAFQGTGPITMDPSTGVLKRNPYSWTRSSTMIYLDSIVNVGFSRGNATPKRSEDIAQLVFNFLTSFLKVFPELEASNLYLAALGYAGVYASYAAHIIYAQQSQLALKLQGIIVLDAVVALAIYQQHVPIAKYVTENNDVFKFDPAKLKKLQANAMQCGYTEFLNKNLRYPPLAPFQNLTKMFKGSPPDLNLWNIRGKPELADFQYQKLVYPGRPDVQKAFNLEGSQKWLLVQQARKRTVIVNSQWDATVAPEGTKLGIQGMNWSGKQGFQKPINRSFMVAGKQAGKYQSERGLTYVEVANAGSMMPRDDGQATLAIFEYLVGHRPAL
ncbi:hypothetical protein PSTT_16063 [Puccinia striiformis]|uniref:AB hydrolase-1 domain-containing protein n=1 Tax=Puccinia striiformis TaxID=27350 RepID=A0A2S4UF84_9BASI|nr:hypothetical protein PSTT_16063 [Puccinia striiformis]